jgi:hypothetical protein
MSLHNPSLWDRLIAQRILHLWDTHVGDPTQKLPLTDKDKLAFARAVLQASSSDSADQIRKLREALTKLCSQFPTDTDMALAGWSMSEINAACDAYDAARSALKESE